MTSSTPRLDAELRIRELQDEFEGLTADQIRNLPMSEYGRKTERSLLPESSNGGVARNLDPVLVEYVEKNAALPEGVHVQEPEQVSVRDMTNEEYAAYRQQNGIGQGGRGIFDSVSSKSEAYRAAASKQAGRTGWVGSNVEDAPKIARPNMVGVDRPNLDARPLSERFGTASNMYRPE